MICGIVNAELQPTISLVVRGSKGVEKVIEAVVDTGFNGFLSLPEEIVSELDLPRKSGGIAILADGREADLENFEATVIWNGCPARILVDQANIFPLVGMELCAGQELSIAVVNGGRVTITPMKHS